MIFPRSTTTICAAVAPPATKFLAKQSRFLRETRCKPRHIKFWHGCIVRLSRGSGSSKKFLGGRALFGVDQSLRKADALAQAALASLDTFGSRGEKLKALARFLVERKQ